MHAEYKNFKRDFSADPAGAQLPETCLLSYNQINTRVVERHNSTRRLRNQRKARKTLAFSKAYRYHRWMSWLSVGLYNFCRPHSSLRIKQERPVIHRSP